MVLLFRAGQNRLVMRARRLDPTVSYDVCKVWIPTLGRSTMVALDGTQRGEGVLFRDTGKALTRMP